LSGSIISDFAVAGLGIVSNAGADYKNTSGVTADFLREAEQRGAQEISNIYYRYYFDYRSEEDITVYEIYGVDQAALKYFSDTDYKKLKSGNYAIVSKQIYIYGDRVVSIPEIKDLLHLTNDDGITRDFEVMGFVDEYPNQISARHKYGNCLTIILAADSFLAFFGESQPMQTNINVSAENIPEFEAWLHSYTSNQNPNIYFISRNTLKSEFDDFSAVYFVLGSSLSFILALVGVLNFVNAIAASVIARRRELAMLQSVGMTGKQLRLTLFFEGGWHAVLSLCFTLTIGVALGLLIVQVIANMTWFFRQSFTVMPSVICAIPLFIICAVCPLVCYKRLTRESLVERLRVE